MKDSSWGWLSTAFALTLAPACGARSGLAADNAREGTNDEAGDGGPSPSPPVVCTNPPTLSAHSSPLYVDGYDPPLGHTVGRTGQIKVWLSDWTAPVIAKGEMIDNVTGVITTPGDRMATAADGLLYEPAVYIAPQSPIAGGTPHFPQSIKGSYNEDPPSVAGWSAAPVTRGAPVDPIPPDIWIDAGVHTFGGPYEAEFVWDVSALGLDPGTYQVIFSVHGGYNGRAIGCVSVAITR
jgi:hypothetical protein